MCNLVEFHSSFTKVKEMHNDLDIHIKALQA